MRSNLVKPDKRKENILPQGAILKNSYVIDSVIGSGTFGITYLGFDKYLGRKVAIKEYYLSVCVTRDIKVSNDIIVIDNEDLFAERKEKFLEEARAISSIKSHENIVSIFDYFEENNTAYMVMDCIEGKTLRDYVKEKEKLTFDETYSIILSLAKSLKNIHSHDFIHRDIKPDNIMITNDGKPVLLDFGSAKDYTEENDGSTKLPYSLNYAAKEQHAVFAPRGPWTDVYGLCAVMFYCLTGKNPTDVDDREYEDNPDRELLNELEQFAADNSVPLHQILVKGMAIEIEERYQNMDELIADLLDCTKKKTVINRVTSSFKKSVASKNKKVQGISKKKGIILCVALMSLIAILTSAVVIMLKNNRHIDIKNLGDGQVVYLTALEDKTEEEIEEAYKIIKNRLDIICKDKKYVMNIKENKAELYIPFEVFGELDPIKVLKYYILRPAKIYFVYDFFHDIELTEEDIESIEYSSDSIMFYLSDNISSEIAKANKEWLELEQRSDGSEIKYTYIEKEEDYDIVPDADNDESKDLYIYFDYDLLVDDTIGYDTLHYLVSSVSEDGKCITVSKDIFNQFNKVCLETDVKASGELIKDIVKYDLLNKHFENTFDFDANMPAAWERKEEITDARIQFGRNQKNPEFFPENEIKAADILYKYDEYAEEKPNESEWMDAREWIVEILDQTGLDYAVGKLSYDDCSIVVRMPMELTGQCYYNLFDQGILYYKLPLAPYRFNDFNRIFSEREQFPSDAIDSDGMEYRDGKVYIKIKNVNELEVEYSKELYEEMLDALAEKDCSNNISLKLNDEGHNYLLGSFDNKNNLIILEKSSLAEDGSIPEIFSIYAKLYNILLNDDYGYLRLFSLKNVYPYNTDIDSLLSNDDFGLRDRRRPEIEAEITEKFANVIGIEPEVRVSDYGHCVIELTQGINDDYATNVYRLLKNTADIFDNNIEYLFDSGGGFLDIVLRDFEGCNKARLGYSIHNGKEDIDIIYWDYLLDDDERIILQEQFLKLKELFENDERFADFTVKIKKYDISGIRKNSVVYKD